MHAPVANARTQRETRARLSVLLIDDEPHVRAFLRAALRSLGIEAVNEAENGEEGVARFERLRPSVVLLDVNMPVLTGTETIQRILALDPEAVVIMVTSDGRHDTVQEFLELGAAGSVLKYLSATQLRATLDELISGLEIADQAA